LAQEGDAVHFVSEAYKHGKAIGALGDGTSLLQTARVPLPGHDAREVVSDQGVVTAATATTEFTEAFGEAVAAHRHPGRDPKPIPA
jgi:catalase